MPRPSDGRARASGFTLLELLIAITLMSLLVVMLFAGLRFGARVWEGESNHSEAMADLRLTQAFLRRQIEQTWRSTLGDDEGDGQARFEGEEARLRFVAPWPSRAAAAQLYVHELYVTDEKRLVVSLSSFRPGEERPDEPRVTVLLQDVESAAFGYYGTDDEDDPAVWRTDWQERPDLPTLIRLTLAFARSTGRSWPDLVVAPRRNAEF